MSRPLELLLEQAQECDRIAQPREQQEG